MTQQQGPLKGRTFDEVVKEMQMTPEEEAALEAQTLQHAVGAEGEAAKKPAAVDRPVVHAPDAEIPDWVNMPSGLKIPPNRQVMFIRFRPENTDNPELGERQCVTWSLSVADEKFATTRTRGDSMRTLTEFSKQTIRAIDGARVTWGGVAEHGMVKVDPFWEQIGARYRNEIQNMYVKTHMFNAEERADFFANCVFVATSSKV